jgi:hypothetical protein
MCHLLLMRPPVRVLPLVGAIACSGCFQMTTVLKVKGDGSGTIEHRMVYSQRALAQMRSLSRPGGGPPVDPASEDQARTLAAAIGPGVSYVTSTAISTAAGQGREATYAFSDVAQLRVSTLTKNPDGNAVLHILVPEPNFLDALGSKGAASQIPMIKALLGGARVLLAVEPEGTVVRTSSPFVDGGRVTLLEVDLDEVLKDETLIARLKAATTQDEAKAAVRTAAGLKINLDREITVEFTPAK